MRNKLITALRIAANKIESGEFAYDWNKLESCNCGAVVCALQGLSKDQLRAMVQPMRNKLGKQNGETFDWKKLTGTFCPVTGISSETLFKELFEVGLSSRDMIELERLRNPKVLARMNLQVIKVNPWWKRLFLRAPKTFTVPARIYYDKANHAAAYMRCWADLIADTDEQDTPEAQGSAMNGVQADTVELFK